MQKYKEKQIFPAQSYFYFYESQQCSIQLIAFLNYYDHKVIIQQNLGEPQRLSTQVILGSKFIKFSIYLSLIFDFMQRQDDKQDWQKFQTKNKAEIFDIITGKFYYIPKPYTNQDLNPDLVIKWQVPNQKNKSQREIKRTLFNHVSAFVNIPEEDLQQAYTMAQKKILSQMQNDKKKNEKDNDEIKIRLQTALKVVRDNQHKNKSTRLILQTGEQEDLQFFCIDEKQDILDGFTLYFNSVMYILQKHCGFRVRAFMMHKKQRLIQGWLGKITDLFQLTSLIKSFGLGKLQNVKSIYLFLNLSQDNLMKVANRYKIKKIIDTTNFDFSLNDPIAKDYRPLKLNTGITRDKDFLADLKRLIRYFQTFEDIQTNAQIIEQQTLSLEEEQKFRSYWEEASLILKYFSQNLEDEVSNQQKIYLYYINRNKLNKGCEKMLARAKKRRNYYQLLKKVCEKYGFPYYDQNQCYGQFMLPAKNSKGGFFEKLELMLSYNPVYSSPFGDLSLFSSMQKTKISYLMLKSAFKISYLNQIGIDIFTLNNDFQKTGKGGENLTVKGGLDGTFVTDRWNIYALFSDIRLIRNYYGQAIAYQVMLKGKIIIYLLYIAVPYVLTYILETLYEFVSVTTSQFQTGLFAISFGIFTLFIQQEEQRFEIEYKDNRQERVFLKYFRGPYIRNPITDQMNEFKEQEGILSIIKSFICICMLAILIIIFAYIFYGCRNFHLSIFDSLYPYQFSVFNLSAIISYSMYFLVGDVFKMKFYGFIVRLMILIKNPPDEASENSLKSYFTFYYLLSLEFIPIIFYYIIEPLSGNQCLGDCFDQYLYYVTARFVFNLAFALTKLFTVVIWGTAMRQVYLKMNQLGDAINNTMSNANQLQKKQEENVLNFQTKLKNLLLTAVKQSQKNVYQEELAKDILALFSYSFYCTAFPLSGVIAFLYICTIYVTTRTSLIYETRRPINKSTPIIPFSKYCSTIYFFGLVANVWVNTFLLGYVEKYYKFVFNLSPKPITRESAFMAKIIATAFFIMVYGLLGFVARQIAIAFSVQTLFTRQRNKYKSYLNNVRKPKSKENKIQNFQPLKFVGRTQNPEKMHHEILKERIQNIKLENLPADQSDTRKSEHLIHGQPQQANAVHKSSARLIIEKEKI